MIPKSLCDLGSGFCGAAPSTSGAWRFRVLAASVLLLSAGPGRAAAAIQFEPPGPGEGIQFEAQGAEFGQGVAFFDLEGDGDLDVYVCTGVDLPNRLFVNQGGFVFVEAVGALGAGDLGEAKGVAAADYDNDGDPDLYVNHWGTENVLYRNDGGVFVDVTALANVGGGGYYSTGLAWGDVDSDGYLDLYVANRGLTIDGEPNELFLNQGDGTFLEVAEDFGVALGAMSFQPVFTDYDNDGDLDLYVANDKFQANRLFRNDGGTGFTDVSAATGSDLAMDGMGVAVGDINLDGDPDLYITNTNPGHRCLVSEGDGTFREVAAELGIDSIDMTGWGCVFFDADLDADEDLFVVHEGPNRLFRNDAGDQAPWVDVSASAGVDAAQISFGAAVADLDNDGDLDIYVSNGNADCEMYRNTTPSAGNSLQIELTGTASNRDAIGARVEVEASGIVQTREIRAGSSYLSQMGGRAAFGLGPSVVAERVTVRWPSGLLESWTDVPANQILALTEGSAPSGAEPSPPGAQASVVRISPNPFRTELTIETNLEQRSPVTLQVFDVAGRLVRTRPLGIQAPGRVRTSWDRRDADGRRVQAGVYWLQLQAPGSPSDGTLAIRAVAVR